MEEKRIFWVASSKKDLEKFPKTVKEAVLFALTFAKNGSKHESAKPFKGCGVGISVMEIVQRGENATFRLLYTAKLKNAIYVLHAFKKKSQKGIKTPKTDVEKINNRYKRAVEHNKELEEQKQ